MKLTKAKLYDNTIEKNLSDRRIFGGDLVYDLDWSNVRYGWARGIFDMQRGNTWFAEHVPMGDEKKDYDNLSPKVKHAYDMALAQIVFMDTFQQRNLSSNIMPYITAPEIAILFVRQAWEEAEHSNSYSVLIDTISDNSSLIFKKHLESKLLSSKNEEILKTFNNLHDNDEPEIPDAIAACFANLALEGIYFYSSFALFWTLARSGKLRATSQMISYIARDEVTHTLLFKKIIKSMKDDYPEHFTPEYIKRYTKIITDAVALEKNWGKEITKGDVAGLTDDMIDAYIEYLANDIMSYVKLPLPYTKRKHPMPWVKETMKFNHIKSSMFEAVPKNYNKVGLIDDW